MANKTLHNDDMHVLEGLEEKMRATLRKADACQRRKENHQLAELRRQSEELRNTLGGIAMDYVAFGNGKDDFSQYALRRLCSHPVFATNLVLSEFVRFHYSPTLFRQLSNHIRTVGHNLHHFFFPSLCPGPHRVEVSQSRSV